MPEGSGLHSWWIPCKGPLQVPDDRVTVSLVQNGDYWDVHGIQGFFDVTVDGGGATVMFLHGSQWEYGADCSDASVLKGILSQLPADVTEDEMSNYGWVKTPLL